MELIKIYKGQLVNARDLYEFLESKQRFGNWIVNRISKYKFIEGKDYVIKLVHRVDGKAGKPRKDYFLTLDTAKELAMVENNEKGREARYYFIEAEKKLRVLENKRLEAFTKLEATKARLLAIVENFGGNHDDYIQIDIDARKVFYNGQELPDNNAPTLILKGRDFATELTTYNATDMESLGELNNSNHKDVRDMIEEKTGKKPEELPREGDIKKLGE